MLQSFQEDLAHLQEGLPEGRKPKARELEEYKVKEEYLQHEVCVSVCQLPAILAFGERQ